MLLRLVPLLLLVPQAGGPTPAPGPAPGDGLAERRARWEAMDDGERQKLRERFEALKSMDPEKRRRMEQRGRRLGDRERRIRDGLSETDRRRIAELDPEKRGQLWREHLEGEARERGRILRDRLPEDARQRLEQASPEERAAILDDLRKKARRAMRPKHLDRLGKKLGLPAEEIERLKNLSPDEFPRAFLSLKRREIEGDVKKRGLPPGITDGAWESWRSLPDGAFFEAWIMNAPRGRGRNRDRRPGRGGGRDGSRERRGETPSTEAQEFLRLARPTIADRTEFADLPLEERMKAMGQRIRSRVLAHLEQHALISVEELDGLRALKGPEFASALRRIQREALGLPPGDGLLPNGTPPGGRRPPRDARRGAG